MKLWVTLGASALCLGLLTVMFLGFGRDPHEVPFMLKGQPAPEFSLKRIDTGEPVTLAQLKGKPLVINFWASWCGPCQDEDPVLRWGYRTYGEDVHFLGLLFEDTEDNARKALARSNPGYPQLVDPLSRTAVDYGVTGVPETYFVDAQGVIRSKFVGPIDPRSLTERIRELSTPSSPEARK